MKSEEGARGASEREDTDLPQRGDQGERRPEESGPRAGDSFHPLPFTLHPSAIDAEGIWKRFGEVEAVRGLDLAVKRGEIHGLVGPDGAGKTTTMRMLCGIQAMDSGRAVVMGHDVGSQPEMARAKIGYMPQRFSLYGDLTVVENLQFFADLYGVSRREWGERSAELLAFGRLEPFADRLAELLSGGMKQKLALACTLIHRPELLLLDEPTTGVDPVSRREFWRILYSLLARGVTILVSTPYMDEAERCNTVSFVAAGRIVVSGTPDELKGLVGREILELRAEPRRAAMQVVKALPEIEDVRMFGEMLHLVAADGESAGAAARAALGRQGIEVLGLRRIQPSMEDAFMSLAVERTANSKQQTDASSFG